MSKSSTPEDMNGGSHRTLEFATMRDNIAACVDRLDAQTFGGRAN